MQSDDVPNIDPTEDLSQILPIQQKRTIAFINHFIMQTVSHLNDFAQSCESRFMEFEYKLQKIEASLLILESQLSSIDNEELKNTKEDETTSKSNSNGLEVELPDVETNSSSETVEQCSEQTVDSSVQVAESQSVRAKDDPRFQKFFKMLQVGVPEPAVKLKMKSEGFDPSILDNPDNIIPNLTEENRS